MKRLMLFIIVTTLSIAAEAADFLDGYIVMTNNDTVQCKIKSGRFLSNPYYTITVINQQGEEEIIHAKDKKIVAFGFVEKYMKYDFLYVDINDRLESGFYQLMVNGARYKLYSRPPTIYGGNPTYVLFNLLRGFTKFEPCLVCPWRKQLREFFKNDDKALQLVDNAPRVNIPKFVIDLNKG